jgi:hypothetical protein
MPLVSRSSRLTRRPSVVFQVEPYAADQAGVLAVAGRMAHQSRRLVHDEQKGVFVKNGK